MNKKIFYIAVASIALFFAGCSKKMPVAVPGGTVNGVGSAIGDGSSLNGTVVPTDANANSGTIGSKNSFQAGKVNSNGKYLGSDGVSRSGFKLLYFASDSYSLDDDQIKKLMSDIPKIKTVAANGKLLVEGNCDEFGTDEYNHALGLKRAKAVKSLLVSAGVDASKIDIVSYGESNPVCTINKPACHAKNRRVEINKN